MANSVGRVKSGACNLSFNCSSLVVPRISAAMPGRLAAQQESAVAIGHREWIAIEAIAGFERAFLIGAP